MKIKNKIIAIILVISILFMPVREYQKAQAFAFGFESIAVVVLIAAGLGYIALEDDLISTDVLVNFGSGVLDNIKLTSRFLYDKIVQGVDYAISKGSDVVDLVLSSIDIQAIKDAIFKYKEEMPNSTISITSPESFTNLKDTSRNTYMTIKENHPDWFNGMDHDTYNYFMAVQSAGLTGDNTHYRVSFNLYRVAKNRTIKLNLSTNKLECSDGGAIEYTPRSAYFDVSTGSYPGGSFETHHNSWSKNYAVYLAKPSTGQYAHVSTAYTYDEADLDSIMYSTLPIYAPDEVSVLIPPVEHKAVSVAVSPDYLNPAFFPPPPLQDINVSIGIPDSSAGLKNAINDAVTKGTAKEGLAEDGSVLINTTTTGTGSVAIPEANSAIATQTQSLVSTLSSLIIPSVFPATFDRLMAMDTSSVEPPVITINLRRLLNAGVSEINPDIIEQNPFPDKESTFVDFGMLNDFDEKGVPLIDYFRSIIGFGVILLTIRAIWKKLTPEHV